MKKLIILAATLTLALSGLAQSVNTPTINFDLIPLSGIPTTIGTNANTNFSSTHISPAGKDMVFWIRAVATNGAANGGTLTFSIYTAPDSTNFQTTAKGTMAVTLNGTNPVVQSFHFPATNFIGVATLKVGSLTNSSATNINVVSWIKAARPR